MGERMGLSEWDIIMQVSKQLAKNVEVKVEP